MLEAVKRCVGEVSAHVFMTDDAPVYVNAWRKVMLDVRHQLLCAWHVDRAFRLNLAKVKGAENKAMMYGILRTVMDERNKETFHRLLDGLNSSMERNEDLREFAEYFTRYYVPRVQLWARTYREGLGINTNMHLESLHKVLKHIYMQGKRVQRVDRAIGTIVKMTRDKVYFRMISLARGRTVSQSRRGLFQRHKRGAELAQDVVQMEQGMYLVPAADGDEHIARLEYFGQRMTRVINFQLLPCFTQQQDGKQARALCEMPVVRANWVDGGTMPVEHVAGRTIVSHSIPC